MQGEQNYLYIKNKILKIKTGIKKGFKMNQMNNVNSNINRKSTKIIKKMN